MSANREHFGSRSAVIMAMAGSAIGLGNIWRFPYMTGEYGGAAFILIYIACTLVLSLPIFLSEAVIGRRTHSNAIGAMKQLAPGSGWRVLGYLSVVTPMIIVSYYSIVGGWSIEYFLRSFSLDFGEFSPSGWTALAFNTIFLALSCGIVALGVKSGIEKFSKMSIPVLFVLIIIILVYSVNMPGAEAGIDYLVKPDLSKVTGKTFAFAMGQSFYSLSLGMGIIITYSSYVHKEENVIATGLGTAVADLMFAILAGFAIMPAVFSVGIKPSAGPGLIFQTLPFVFTEMGAGVKWISVAVSAVFFLTVIVAAMTSSVSTIEVGVAYLVEEKKIERKKACLLVFILTWLLGLACALSIKAFGMVDAFASNFLLTIGALLVVLFVGWKMKRKDVRDEITNGGTRNTGAFPVIYFLIRFIAPLAVLVIFISNLVLR
ncbi:MAG: sodium-dependent transporter [Bacteroidales bacterium]|nr:sodium-dependent transporter [Bacteroidales bacterium]